MSLISYPGAAPHAKSAAGAGARKRPRRGCSWQAVERLEDRSLLAPITITPTAITPTEGQSFSGQMATFTTTNAGATASDFTATVHWGDGTGTSAGTITEDADSVFHITAQHTYTSEGAYPAAFVTVQSNFGAAATTGFYTQT